jgi:type III restriction enzyme
MQAAVNFISNRLSLRPPQRDSLEILDRIREIISLKKDPDCEQALSAICAEFPTVTDFERAFPSLCFALATGVGKTRLMGAFISYLHQVKGIAHFFVLSPNLTIYNKLIADFTPNSAKYVFQGIPEFIRNPPEIITGDNYESGRGVRKADLFGEIGVHVNIFNIGKINARARGEDKPRIRRLSEYIGESYFDYLSKLEDLVLIMDESHRYRRTAAFEAIKELRPILGLELTATPQVQEGAKTVAFKNVIYSYPLSSALRDGFVKEPAIATRENFNPDHYSGKGLDETEKERLKLELEMIKLEDGVRIHEHTKVQLEVYARQNGRKPVKPFMLVVAEDIRHAKELEEIIAGSSFFEGRYKGRVLTVHSNQSGEEKDETIQQLLRVEDPSDSIEIVVHVNKLSEGWDVTNLYTIVPLRKANARNLVEQSIGRGLRLPYGKRTGVADVDRLTVVSHDKFQEIIDEANRPGSVFRTGVVIGRDIPVTREKVIVVEPNLAAKVTGLPAEQALSHGAPEQQPIFNTAREQEVANVTLRVLKQFEHLPRSTDLLKPEIQQQIVQRVAAEMRPVQGELSEVPERVNLAQVVAKTIDLHNEMSIDIPRIIVFPTGEVSSGFRDFNLSCRNIRLQPVTTDILIQHLLDQSRYRLVSSDGSIPEDRLEDYLVRGLIDFTHDVSYDDHAELLYKLAGQLVKHLQSYLSSEDDVRNVLQYHQKALVELIHVQMLEHYEETATAYEVHVSKGFTTLKSETFSVPAGESARPFRAPVDEKLLIRGMLFDGFKKCLYPAQKFDSDSERRFAVILEDDATVLKWFKPTRGDFQIYYRQDDAYEPDFVVETKTRKWICEPKRASEMKDEIVLAKARAAALWCKHASSANEDKPWSYMLVPHDSILGNMTLAGLAAAYAFTELPPERSTVTK